jgi:hypothetical protein
MSATKQNDILQSETIVVNQDFKEIKDTPNDTKSIDEYARTLAILALRLE